MTTLEITGSGAMKNYTTGNKPWESVITQMTTVTIGSSVTTIGSYSFEGATQLKKSIMEEQQSLEILHSKDVHQSQQH